MDQERFAQGMRQYRSGNFAAAAQDFLESAEPGIARGNGQAFHQAGNAFLQLGRNADALTMYQNALRDDTYDNMSAVYSNIGHVHAKEGNFAQSAEAYEVAATYPECEKPYKCHLRVAQNHMKLGSIDKAAIAYKKAALDVGNPARSKALYNLALCLLELKQPLSAVESLKLALDFGDCENRDQVFSSLGIAYTMLDSDEEAVEAFGHAEYLLGEEGLSPIAAAAYAAAKARLAASAPSAAVITEAPEKDGEENVSLTGEIKSIDTAGLVEPIHGEPISSMGTEEEVAQFFALSDEELVEQGRLLSKVDKPRLKWWKALLAVVLGLLLMAALAVGAAYYFGLGWPPANDIVWETLSAYGSERPISQFWTIGEDEAQNQMAANVPREAVFTIQSPVGRMNESTVAVVATDSAGNEINLVFTLQRQGLGFKIVAVSVGAPASATPPTDDAGSDALPADAIGNVGEDDAIPAIDGMAGEE